MAKASYTGKDAIVTGSEGIENLYWLWVDINLSLLE
ncbi:MAG: hypothetical protein ACJA0N_001286 [Pseudohongiellaceae bacterium]|jgi:hypothetical protein